MEERAANDPFSPAFGRLAAPRASARVRQSHSLVGAETIRAIEGQSAAISPVGARREPREAAVAINLGDRIYNRVILAFAGLIVAILALMVAVLLWQSRASISRFGLSFVTTSTWDPIANVYGGAPSIIGTVYTSLIALLIAGPVGVMIAVFLAELAPRRVRFPLGFIVELLAAVPSIVFGLWALYVLVPFVRDHIEPPLISLFGNSPLFSGAPLGLGFLSASLILAIMILPTIAAITRDVMLAVPNSQREAMLALGATRWETIWKVVIPAARSGIIGALILGLGRAVGETMAAQMVIGNVLTKFQPSLLGQGTTITATLVNQFAEATGTLYRSSLIELALILMLVTVILNALARVLVWRVVR